MTRRAGLAYLASLAAALAFAAWTYLTLATDALDPLDATSRTPPPDLMAWQGQVLAAIAVLTLPVVVTVVVGVLAVWAARRRLHNLAWAMGIGAPLTWGATNIAKTVVARPRPNPRSASRFTGKIACRLSRLATDTNATPPDGRPP